MKKPPPKRELRCSFCCKSSKAVEKLITGTAAYICNECVTLCSDVLKDETKALKTDATETKPGYHLTKIERGTLGETSKIQEELDELVDAEKQSCRILQLIEVSDLIGAVVAYLEKHHPGVALADAADMSRITRRAFENGHRS